MNISRKLFEYTILSSLRLFLKLCSYVVSCIFSWLNPCQWLTWNNYSENMLRSIEKRILQIVRTPHRGFYVDIGPVVGPADKIWTVSFNTDSEKIPLVLLHGLGAGVALWCLNLDALAATRPVYVIDILGFGRSSRPNFSTESLEAEHQLVRSIEEWRREMGLNKMIVLGHSMGGFLGASYSISYPDYVEHLILADPWGFTEKSNDYKQIPLWVKTVSYMMKPFNPLAGIRVAGPFGPWFINTVRPDISKKYSVALNDVNLIPEYIYQCNSQYPSGETAFRSMMADFGWAKNPIVKRIDLLSPQIPITLLYGSRSWIDHLAEDVIKEKRSQNYFKIQIISGAGHHIYADKPENFNQIVLDACKYTDSLRSPQNLAILPGSNDYGSYSSY